jgi:hypothetical protein
MDHDHTLSFDALAYDRLAGLEHRGAPSKDRPPGPAFAAIVCLTRGYRELRHYDPLIARNRSIYDTINRIRSRQYPLVI